MAIENKEMLLRSDAMDERANGAGRIRTGAKIDSAVLLGGRNEIAIQHQGELYILRHTRAGKLILTK